MSHAKKFPGAPHIQQILHTIVDFYEPDERVLAVILFGSLSRGGWDLYSDADLDIIMSDETSIDARVELQGLCAALKRKHGLESLIIADIEEGDVVLGNLVEFSIRYHVLNDTKPAILDSMQLLAGSLSLDEIRAGTNYDYLPAQKAPVNIVNEVIRFTLELRNAIMRQKIWMGVEMLHRIRAHLMEMYAISHNAARPILFLDSCEDPELRELFVSLLPHPTLESLEDAFRAASNILENHLDRFSAGTYQLTASQQQIVNTLKELPRSGDSET